MSTPFVFLKASNEVAHSVKLNNFFLNLYPICNPQGASLGGQGDGTHNGYITFTDNDGEITAKWDGNVKTTLTKDGQPRTTFNGDWTWTKATGHYAAYTSSGKYTGYAPSPDKVYIEWEGQLQPR